MKKMLRITVLDYFSLFLSFSLFSFSFFLCFIHSSIHSFAKVGKICDNPQSIKKKLGLSIPFQFLAEMSLPGHQASYLDSSVYHIYVPYSWPEEPANMTALFALIFMSIHSVLVLVFNCLLLFVAVFGM